MDTPALPPDTAVPLLGHAWNFSSDELLSGAADITEILSCAPYTWGLSLTVIYRRWKLL